MTVIDLTKLKSGDSLNHGKFAESPGVVRFIGTQLASGQDITTRSAGLGGQLGRLVAGVSDSAGHIATAAMSVPILVVDPQSRETLSDNLRSVVPGANDGPASDLTDGDELAPAVAPPPSSAQPSPSPTEFHEIQARRAHPRTAPRMEAVGGGPAEELHSRRPQVFSTDLSLSSLPAKRRSRHLSRQTGPEQANDHGLFGFRRLLDELPR